MCASRFQRTSREVGGDAGGLCRPKANAAVRCQTSLPRICRARFSASGGRRPLSFVSARKAGEAGREPREGGGRFCEFGTTPRTINRPRGLRLFPRRRDAARTLLGHFAQGERIVLAPVRARVGHLQGRCGDGASGAVGVVGAAEIVHYVWLDRATVRHSALFLAQLGAAVSRHIAKCLDGRKRVSRQNANPSIAAKPRTQRPRQNGVRGVWGIGASLQAKRG